MLACLHSLNKVKLLRLFLVRIPFYNSIIDFFLDAVIWKVGTSRLPPVLQKNEYWERRQPASVYYAIENHDSIPHLLALNPVISSLRVLVLLSDPHTGVLIILYWKISFCCIKHLKNNCIIMYLIYFFQTWKDSVMMMSERP